MQPSLQNIITAESTQQTFFPYDHTSAITSVKNKKASLDFKEGGITIDAGASLHLHTT